MFAEIPVRWARQTRPLPQFWNGVLDTVPRCDRRQLERHYEGNYYRLTDSKGRDVFLLGVCLLLLGCITKTQRIN